MDEEKSENNPEQILSVKNLGFSDNFCECALEDEICSDGGTSTTGGNKCENSDGDTDSNGNTTDDTTSNGNVTDDTTSDGNVTDDSGKSSPEPTEGTVQMVPVQGLLPPPPEPARGGRNGRPRPREVYNIPKTLNEDKTVNLPSVTDTDAKDLNEEIVKKTVNTTMVQDENSKYFTVIHDLPARHGAGPCKKCPKMQLQTVVDWWKVQQNLAPRTRHSIRITLIVLGSALLLLTIFLLARLPNSPKDVLTPFKYDLPPDDAFRPPVTVAKGSPPPVDHPDLREQEEEHPLQDVVNGNTDLNKPANMQKIHAAMVSHSRIGRLPHIKNSMALDKQQLEIELARKKLMSEMPEDLPYSEKAYRVSLKLVSQIVEKERTAMTNKEENIWSEGATPLRILLVSTWRSGSTFLGQVLQEHPGVFQHYEPFSFLGVRQIRSGVDAFQSQQLLHRLLECRFKGQDEYLDYTREHPSDMSGHNKRIWRACNFNTFTNICSNATFLTETCNMFPIQLVKTVRLRLNLTQLFLGETRLNAKVVFLVRDPRATISSRKSSVTWCDSNPDCSSPETLCTDIQRDLKVSAAFERLFPKSFVMVKYEDLANHPEQELRKLLSFLGMEYTDEISEFVKTHTEADDDKPWSVARKSAARISRWKENLKSDEIEEIEKVCRPVLEKLNYELEN